MGSDWRWQGNVIELLNVLFPGSKLNVSGVDFMNRKEVCFIVEQRIHDEHWTVWYVTNCVFALLHRPLEFQNKALLVYIKILASSGHLQQGRCKNVWSYWWQALCQEAGNGLYQEDGNLKKSLLLVEYNRDNMVLTINIVLILVK